MFGVALAVAALGFVGLVGLAMLVGLFFTRNVKPAVVTGTENGEFMLKHCAVDDYLHDFHQAPLVFLSAPELLVTGCAFWRRWSPWPGPSSEALPWRQVRQDIGWFTGPRPILEPLFGPIGNILALPWSQSVCFRCCSHVVAKSVGPVWGLALAVDEFSHDSIPSHPIIQFSQELDGRFDFRCFCG